MANASERCTAALAHLQLQAAALNSTNPDVIRARHREASLCCGSYYQLSRRRAYAVESFLRYASVSGQGLATICAPASDDLHALAGCAAWDLLTRRQ